MNYYLLCFITERLEIENLKYKNNCLFRESIKVLNFFVMW